MVSSFSRKFLNQHKLDRKKFLVISFAESRQTVSARYHMKIEKIRKHQTLIRKYLPLPSQYVIRKHSQRSLVLASPCSLLELKNISQKLFPTPGCQTQDFISSQNIFCFSLFSQLKKMRKIY